jgi:hypothetical protein
MFKKDFIDRIEQLFSVGEKILILELGSGRSEAIADLLKKNKNIFYQGVEPYKRDYDYAIKNIGNLPNVKLINSLADRIEDQLNFDICFSLSVLEHVKNLENFLQQSVISVKSGGYVIHRYDLGHALFPSSTKEKLQIFLGNKMPWILPENKFVNYVDVNKVKNILEKNGAEIIKITYHQMSSHKKLIKYFHPEDDKEISLIKGLINWEYDISDSLKSMPTDLREKLFPTVCVWAKKK